MNKNWLELIEKKYDEIINVGEKAYKDALENQHLRFIVEMDENGNVYSWYDVAGGNSFHASTQVIAKLAVLVRNLEPKQGRIREEHDLWNEKWIIAHVRRTLISYGLYESGKS